MLRRGIDVNWVLGFGCVLFIYGYLCCSEMRVYIHLVCVISLYVVWLEVVEI